MSSESFASLMLSAVETGELNSTAEKKTAQQMLQVWDVWQLQTTVGEGSTPLLLAPLLALCWLPLQWQARHLQGPNHQMQVSQVQHVLLPPPAIVYVQLWVYVKEIDNVYKWHMGDTFVLFLKAKVSAGHTCEPDGSKTAISLA